MLRCRVPRRRPEEEEGGGGPAGRCIEVVVMIRARLLTGRPARAAAKLPPQNCAEVKRRRSMMTVELPGRRGFSLSTAEERRAGVYLPACLLPPTAAVTAWAFSDRFSG